jgi:HEPN domain-containing protein
MEKYDKYYYITLKQYSTSYYRAYKLVNYSDLGKEAFNRNVCMFLLSHAWELLCKAYLVLVKGTSKGELKKLGHSLHLLYLEVAKEVPSDTFPEDAEEYILWINSAYLDYRYGMDIGFKVYENTPILEAMYKALGKEYSKRLSLVRGLPEDLSDLMDDVPEEDIPDESNEDEEGDITLVDDDGPFTLGAEEIEEKQQNATI